MNYRNKQNKELNPFIKTNVKKTKSLLESFSILSEVESIYIKLNIKIKKELNHNVSVKQILLLLETDKIPIPEILLFIDKIGSDITTAVKFRKFVGNNYVC
jgi:hypothetical protein